MELVTGASAERSARVGTRPQCHQQKPAPHRCRKGAVVGLARHGSQAGQCHHLCGVSGGKRQRGRSPASACTWRARARQSLEWRPPAQRRRPRPMPLRGPDGVDPRVLAKPLARTRHAPLRQDRLGGPPRRRLLPEDLRLGRLGREVDLGIRPREQRPERARRRLLAR